MQPPSWRALTTVALAALATGCAIMRPSPGPRYVSSGSAVLEVNVDRPGSDYRSFDLASGRLEECRDTCLVEPQCLAFTYVNAGVQGRSARCRLKTAVPRATPSDGCTSGVKNATHAAGDHGAPPRPV